MRILDRAAWIAAAWAVAVALADVFHTLRGAERTDAVDRVLHYGLDYAPLAYGCLVLAGVYAARNLVLPRREGVVTAMAIGLIAYLVVELVYMQLFSRRPVGSTTYMGMWPPFVSSVLPALLTFALGHSTVRTSRKRIFLDLVAALWLLGGVAHDARYFCEGGARGTGSCWHLPIAGDGLRMLTIAIAFGLPLWPLLSLGSFFALVYLTSTAEEPRDKWPIAALATSCMAFGWNAFMWSAFIWD